MSRRSARRSDLRRSQSNLTLFKQIDNRLGQAAANMSLGIVETALGRHDGARAAFDEALILFKQFDNLLGQASAYLGLGELEHKLKRDEAARAAYALAAELYRAAGHDQLRDSALDAMKKLTAKPRRPQPR